MKDLSSYRKDYSKHMLDDENTPSNPFTLFNQWFNESRIIVQFYYWMIYLINWMTIE